VPFYRRQFPIAFIFDLNATSLNIVNIIIQVKIRHLEEKEEETR